MIARIRALVGFAASLAAQVGSRRELEATAALALAIGVVALNSMSTVVALPAIADDLGGSIAAQWLVTVYLIAMIACPAVGGRLGDQVGNDRALRAGLVAFALASVGMALAGTMALLLCLRTAQAVAGAVIVPNALALARRDSPDAVTVRLGLVQSAAGVGAIVGAPLASLALAVASWRELYAFNVVLALVVVALARRALPLAARLRPAAELDVLGAALFTATTTLACLLMMGVADGAATIAALVAATIAFGATLAAVERARREPVVPRRVLRQRTFQLTAAGVAVTNLGLYAVTVALPFAASRARGGIGAELGVYLALAPAAAAVTSVPGWWLVRRGIRRPSAAAGIALFALALALVVGGDGVRHPALLAVGLLLAGAGIGVAWAVLQTAMLQDADIDDVGAAAGAFSALRYLGAAIGSSAAAAILSHRHDPLGGGPLLVLLAGVGVVGAGCALLLPAPRSPVPADASHRSRELKLREHAST